MKKIIIFLTVVTVKIFSQTNPEWIILNTTNSALPSNQIQEIVIDKLNRKWISVPGEGILKIDDNSWTIFNTSNSNIPSNSFAAIKVDNDLNFWATGSVNLILTKYDGTDWVEWTSSTISIPGVLRTSIEIDFQNHIWLLSRDDGTIHSTYYLVEFSDDTNWTSHSSFNSSNGHKQLLYDNNNQ